MPSRSRTDNVVDTKGSRMNQRQKVVVACRRFFTGVSGWLGFVVLAVGASAVIWFEKIRSDKLSWDGLWNARATLWSGILVFANLVVLWWYALRTEDLAKVSQAQHALAMKQYLEATKPIVVVAPVRTPVDPDNVHYAVTNIGSGIAVNIYEVAITGGTQRQAHSTNLGGLAGASERLLPPDLDVRFMEAAMNPGREAEMILLTETMFTQTGGWVGTINRIGQDGEVIHRLIQLPGLERRQYSLPELLETFGRSIEEQVADFTEASRRSILPVEWKG
jgi:hypothetical protein